MNRCGLLLGCFLLVGCGDCGGGTVKPPGDELIGSFSLHAKGIYESCGINALNVTFDYSGTFSRTTDGGAVIYTAGGARYDAGFDGQFIDYDRVTSVTATVRGDAGITCGACDMKMSERAHFVLLSDSQSKALGDKCPTTALDGGVPPADEDAGILRPDRTDGGFDAVRICGELRSTVTGEGFCDQACYSCVQVYRVTGERQ